MNRDSFVIFASYMKSFSKLNMEQRGVLITAMMNYQIGDELPEMDALTDMAFSFIKDDMDFNNQKYDEKCERNKENGKKGGRPKANGFSENPKKPNGFSEEISETQQNPTKPTKTLYEYDYDYESEYEHEEIKKPKTKKFIKPTVEEIRAYCQERNNNVDPERFYDFYESKGWKVGNQGMKDWKSAVRTWERRSDDKPQEKPPDKLNMSQTVYDKIHNFNERSIDYSKLQAEVFGGV